MRDIDREIGNFNVLESVCDTFWFVIFSIDNRRRRARLNWAYRHCALSKHWTFINRQESQWFNAMHTPKTVCFGHFFFNIFHFVFLGIHKSQAPFRFYSKQINVSKRIYLYLQSIVFSYRRNEFPKKNMRRFKASSSSSGFSGEKYF